MSGGANNTYSGNTAISAGTLEIQKSGALGTTAGTTATIFDGATLGLNGNGLAVTKNITVGGVGVPSSTGLPAGAGGTGGAGGAIAGAGIWGKGAGSARGSSTCAPGAGSCVAYRWRIFTMANVTKKVSAAMTRTSRTFRQTCRR